jgi:hypothetical protein
VSLMLDAIKRIVLRESLKLLVTIATTLAIIR